MTKMMSGEDFEKTIQNFDANFARLLLNLLERLSHYSTTDCEHQMLNIIARLDHNGFYTAQLEKRSPEGRAWHLRYIVILNSQINNLCLLSMAMM